LLGEAWWTCPSSKPGKTWRCRNDILVMIGQHFSVISPYVRRRIQMIETPDPTWQGPTPSWFGIACTVARVEMWLPNQSNLGLLEPFPLLVLLPQRDLPDAPPFVMLGAQFLMEYRVRVELDCALIPGAPRCGQLMIPPARTPAP
jgi:hypothetical protein